MGGKPLMVRLSPRERQDVEEAAARAGQRLSDWARAALLGAPPAAGTPEVRIVYDEPPGET
jgi:hypothetical protein